ncbi:hypothetical protein [Pseudomonas zhanjiangensis]|uniref:DNA repair protein n=1 Tax=Pseudomonas zhanjiangensis TaxID=3239015 RepID=A0ABV3YVB4_9PSED
MSPLVITLLIVSGIAILILIAFVNQMVEKNKLEKARLKADLSDRVRRCANVCEAIPGQLMTAPLKLLLSRLQLQLLERLLALDKGSADIRSRLEELRQLVDQGESIAVRNPVQPILTEAQAKEVRFQLENLHGQITRAAQEALLPGKEAKQWVGEIRHMLVQVHLELFANLGQQGLQQNHPGQARLAFERGVQFLRKQPDPARYQAQLKQFEGQLARANALVLNSNTPSADAEDSSELTEGLKALESEEDWKKKNIYD